MKKLAITVSLIILVLTGCSYQSKIVQVSGKSPDNNAEVTVQEETSGFTMFSSHSDPTKVAKAYETIVKVNRGTTIPSHKSFSSDSSGFIPEGGEVLFSTKGNQKSNGPLLVNDSNKKIKILNGPYKTDFFLNPNESVEPLKLVKPGDELIFTLEWMENLPEGSEKEAKTGHNTVVRRPKQNQTEVYVSQKGALENGQI